jgi:hypothetical protein
MVREQGIPTRLPLVLTFQVQRQHGLQLQQPQLPVLWLALWFIVQRRLPLSLLYLDARAKF